MEYALKNKIPVTRELLNDLEIKSWQEIEHLQGQIANLEVNETSSKVIQLLSGLLTSYYVFAGGLENLTAEKVDTNIIAGSELDTETSLSEPLDPIETKAEVTSAEDSKEDTQKTEPFEYFVDFDEPIGDPLTDEDLYNI